MPDQLYTNNEEIPLMMANMLTKSKKFSCVVSTESFEYNHPYFSKHQYHADAMLSNFAENLLDISLNEVNVHYLGH